MNINIFYCTFYGLVFIENCTRILFTVQILYIEGCKRKSVYFQRTVSIWRYTDLFPQPLVQSSDPFLYIKYNIKLAATINRNFESGLVMLQRQSTLVHITFLIELEFQTGCSGLFWKIYSQLEHGNYQCQIPFLG